MQGGPDLSAQRTRESGLRPGDRRHHAEDVVEVDPIARLEMLRHRFGSQPCQAHLSLRVLGIDAAYRNNAADAELVREGAAQCRIVLTQDRGLLMRRALWAGAYVHGDQPDDQLADVLDRFAPPLTPGTRCTVCNGLLATVAPEEVADRLEAGTRRCYAEFARCRACARLYWHGAHGRGLARIVERARATVARHSP